MSQYTKKIHEYFDMYLQDLQTLIAIQSISKEDTAFKPFGKEVADCFNVFSKIAKRLGFQIEEDDGYAISANVQVNNDTSYIGILGHLDVVLEGNIGKWNYPPFMLSIDNGILYGRGVNDDKGPLLAQLYCIKILKDLGYPFLQNVKVIAGGAEETTWHCMEHYFKTHKQPIVGYSPDGNFPIVNGEKGIVTFQIDETIKSDGLIQVNSIKSSPIGYAIPDYVEIVCKCNSIELLDADLASYFTNQEATFVFTGKSALTRNPQKADNALFKMTDFILSKERFFDDAFVKCCKEISNYFMDPYGRDCHFYHEDADMGKSTIAVFDFVKYQDSYSYKIDLRFDQNHDVNHIQQQIELVLNKHLKVCRTKRALFVDRKDPLIQILSRAYEKICHEKAECICKGGASYARVLDKGIAFGATFDGYDTRPHKENENMRISDLIKAMEIYCEAIRLLACEPVNFSTSIRK